MNEEKGKVRIQHSGNFYDIEYTLKYNEYDDEVNTFIDSIITNANLIKLPINTRSFFTSIEDRLLSLYIEGNFFLVVLSENFKSIDLEKQGIPEMNVIGVYFNNGSNITSILNTNISEKISVEIEKYIKNYKVPKDDE